MHEENMLLRVGSIIVSQKDLDHHLQEKYAGRSDEQTRKKALDELADRARLVQAALDADLDHDPVVRAEMARLLSNRLRETLLFPRLREALDSISEARLREIYAAEIERFQSPEKRQVAVLWLNPGADPERAERYEAKMTNARDWFFNKSGLVTQAEAGFSTLAVDHSEHAATRFKGGVLGWMEQAGGSTDWSRAVAEIVFSLQEVGEVSPVIVRPEGIFLVRWMALQPALQSSFAEVQTRLEREEQVRLRKQLEAEFVQELEAKYPVETR